MNCRPGRPTASRARTAGPAPSSPGSRRGRTAVAADVEWRAAQVAIVPESDAQDRVVGRQFVDDSHQVLRRDRVRVSGSPAPPCRSRHATSPACDPLENPRSVVRSQHRQQGAQRDARRRRPAALGGDPRPGGSGRSRLHDPGLLGVGTRCTGSWCRPSAARRNSSIGSSDGPVPSRPDPARGQRMSSGDDRLARQRLDNRRGQPSAPPHLGPRAARRRRRA